MRRHIVSGLLCAALALYPEFTLAQIQPGGGLPITPAGTSATTAGAIQGVTGGVPVAVTGTFSASLGGFTPTAGTAGRMAPLNVVTTAGGSSGTLPTGAVVVVSNVGTTNPMYCNVAGIAATVSDQLIGANSWFAFTIPGGVTTLNCISTGGTTTANGLGGAGLPTGAGGGEGGGSGGVVTQPTASLLNATVVGTGTFSTQLTGTTNNIQNVTGTVSLPTGASTLTAQNTGNTSLATIATNTATTAAGTTAANAQAVQGVTGGVPIPVSGSFSSGAFAPPTSGTGMAPFTVTSGTPVTTTIAPTGQSTLLIISAPTTPYTVHCALGGSAASTDTPISPGQTIAFTIGSATAFTCEASTGAQVISAVAGSGSYQVSAGVSPSINTAGAATGFANAVQGAAGGVAVGTSSGDGAFVTLGSKADAAATTGSATEIALIKGLITQVQASIPAGTNLIGQTATPINVTPTDCSGTITTGGTAQSAIAATATIHGFTIANIDASTGSGEPLWISFTTTAAAGTIASYPLAAPTATTFAGMGSYSTPPGFGSNHAVSIIAATTSHKFSCTSW